MGIEIITGRMGVPACNAMSHGAALGDRVIEALGLEDRRAGGGMSARIPAFVLGGSGYVAGELLRLIAQHPQFALAAALSDSRPGEPLAAAFPHLACAYPEARFSSQSELQQLLCAAPRAALFSAAPHGVSAGLVDSLLGAAQQARAAVRVVDISADFRYPTPRPTRRCTRTRTARRSACASSPAPCPSTWRAPTPRTSPTPAASPAPCCSRAYRCSPPG